MARKDEEPTIRESVFTKAARTRRAAPLLEHLGELELDQAHVDRISQLIRLSGPLILQRSDPAAQAERDTFLDDLRGHLVRQAPDADLSAFDQAVKLVRIAEDGHQRILACLSRTPFSRKPPATRASAVVSRMEANLAALVADAHAAMRSAKEMTIPGGPELRDATGRVANLDDVMTGMVRSLGGTLLMEGHANDWFDAEGRLVLPELPRVEDEDIMLAGQSELLSVSWSKWTRMQETARYGSSDIDALEGENLPSWALPPVKLVYERERSRDTLDYIANARTIDREGISAAALHNTMHLFDVGKGITGEVAGAPAEWISPEELVNSLSLSEAVGYDVLADAERPGGLRLIQWIRGYTCLAALASSFADNAALTLKRVPSKTLFDLLQRASLSRIEADVFLDAVSFGRASRDLFDAPLVRTAGEWLLIGPALAAPRLAKIVPSLLASRKIQLRRKGMAFEKRVVSFLRKQGLDARNVKVKRDGGEYDYDVVFPWGDRIFHFECKNHTLSGNDPVQAHHFLEELASDLNQVSRLRNALAEWPDILTDAFGPEVAGREVVHCILQNDTYCIPGGIEGVYVYDWSALTRFFENGWFSVSHTHQLPGSIRFENRVKIVPIWSGDRPTPADLIAQLEDPAQFRVVTQHLELETVPFPIDETTIAADTVLRRRPADLASMAEALGGSAQALRDELSRIDEQISAARRLIRKGSSTQVGERGQADERDEPSIR